MLNGNGRRARRALGAVAMALLAGCSTVSPSTPAQGSSDPASPAPSGDVSTDSGRPVGTFEWETIADLARDSDAGTIKVMVSGDELQSWWLTRYPGRVVPWTSLSDPLYVAFNIIVPGNCPQATLEKVVLDAEQKLVYGEFRRNIAGRPSCGDIGGGHLFLVAVARAGLPPGQVRFRLEKEFSVCADCGRELEEVTLEVR